MSYFKKTSVLLLASTLSLIVVGCGYSNDGKNVVGKEKFISATPLFDITSEQIQPIVSQLAPNHPAFGIKGYRVVYKTRDIKGNVVNASGLLTIPVPTKTILDALKSDGKSYTMSIVSDQHGTIFPDSEAPTSSVIATHKPTSQSVLFSAIGGFITLQPDYVGFGQSKDKIHPYLLAKPSADSVIDLIKSTIKFGNDNSLPLNGQIFLSGFSEGGYVTLATVKEIEKNHPELHIKGSAPMSGPYDLNITGLGVLKEEQIARPDFIGGIIYSYATAYDINLSNIMPEQYASKLPTLYDKEKNSTQIMSELTHETKDFIKPEFRLDFLTNSINPLRKAFVENSVDNFKPKSDMRLYYCGGDTVIPPLLALKASREMGVDAYDLDSSLGHDANCAKKAYAEVLKYFVELRSK